MVGVSSRDGKNPNQAAVSFRVGMMMMIVLQDGAPQL